MEVTCEFDIDVRVLNNPRYVCYANMIEPITKPRTWIKTFKGQHAENMTNKDVVILVFFEQQIDFFPRGLARAFPNLRSLVIENCGLKEIHRRDFIELENLSGISLARNNLKTLPDDLFMEMPKLQTANFFNNPLQSVSSKILYPIKEHVHLADFGSDGTVDKMDVHDRFRYGLDSLQVVMQWIDKQFSAPQSLGMFPHKVGRFYEMAKFSDFIIQVGNKEFKAHKLVLATASTVFDAMMTHEAIEEAQKGRVVIKDFRANDVEDFLKFIYCGLINEENAFGLLAFAVIYDVSTLKEACESIILDYLNEENVHAVLHLADQFSNDLLLESAYDFIESMIEPTRETSACQWDSIDEITKAFMKIQYVE